MANTFTLFLFLLVQVLTVYALNPTFTLHNNCQFTVWATSDSDGAYTVGMPILQPLLHGENHTFYPEGAIPFTGRIWGKTGCTENNTAKYGYKCITGDCNPPVTLGCTPPGTTVVGFTKDGGVIFQNGFNLVISIFVGEASINITFCL